MTSAAEPVVIPPAEPDLIDRIAGGLPEEFRAEYYRELVYCRSLPESDEMLRVLRAMQFLVVLIDQAPSRVAEERQRLDTLLATAMGNMSKINTASEGYYNALQRKLNALPADVAERVRPEVVAGQINESLRQEFVRSTIPQTAEALSAVAEQMESVCSEFTATADALSHTYRGAAQGAQKAVASLKTEICQATESAARFTSDVSGAFSKAYRWMLVLATGAALVIGMAIGTIYGPSLRLLRATTTVAQPVLGPIQTAPEVADKAPAVPKAATRRPKFGVESRDGVVVPPDNPAVQSSEPDEK